MSADLSKYEYNNFSSGIEFNLDRYLKLQKDLKIVFTGSDKDVVKKLRRKLLRKKMYSNMEGNDSSVDDDHEQESTLMPQMSDEERRDLLKRVLLAQMSKLSLQQKDYDHIVDALKDENQLKILCGCLALQKVIDKIFVQHTRK